jgi:hypothetical protein
MRRLLVGSAVIALMAVVTPGAAEAAPRPPKVQLSIDNFRFCASAPCTPLDQGYVRTDSGPVAGTDNPNGTISVKRGSIVVWTYRDSTCDSISGCTGHNIWFENGKTGVKQGAVPARKGLRTITVKITQKPGTTIRYFCTVNGHYMIGMTGVLHVT